jgi:hypothetical protein
MSLIPDVATILDAARQAHYNTRTRKTVRPKCLWPAAAHKFYRLYCNEPPARFRLPPGKGGKMEIEDKKKFSLLSRIDNREEALKIIKESSYVFLFIAILNGATGFFITPLLIGYAIIFSILAILLLRLKSRVVAVSLLLVSGSSLVMTLLRNFNSTKAGGPSIILAIIVFWISIKALEATIKLHGKFKENQNDPLKN